MKKLSFFVTSLTFALWLFVNACKPMPNDGVPFYLEVDSVQVITTGTQGANTHNIPDIWVEANADNLGAFSLPITFPVLLENQVSFTISAGIEQSGQSGYRIIYPFYNPDTITLDAHRGNNYKFTPKFSYKGTSIFTFICDFESGNEFDPNVMKPVSDSNTVYGTRCGKLSVTSTDSSALASTTSTWDLPEGQEIWLEFDYKADVPFYAGFYGKAGSGATVRNDILFVTAKPKWNHLYVKLSEAIAAVRANSYSIYFEALRPYGTTGGNVYIDNVKLIHF